MPVSTKVKFAMGLSEVRQLRFQPLAEWMSQYGVTHLYKLIAHIFAAQEVDNSKNIIQ